MVNQVWSELEWRLGPYYEWGPQNGPYLDFPGWSLW